jgi:hypothetical protein
MLASRREAAAGVARVGLLILATAMVCGWVGAGTPLAASFPMRAEGGPVTVPVRIGEQGPFDFILDTGAGGTLIDESLVRELGLPVTGTTVVGSPLEQGGTTRPMVSLTGVMVGEMRLPDIEAASSDLSVLFGSAGGPRGVLSTRVFKDHLVTFDYPAGRVEIAPGQLPEPDGQTTWAYPAEAPIPELPLAVAGRPVSVHLDSGSPGDITLPLEMAAKLPLEGEPVEVGQGGMIGRTFKIYAATLDGVVTIGAMRIERPRLEFIEGIPLGNVGIQFLRGRVLTLDPAHHRLRLVAGQPGEGAQEEAERVAVPRVVSVTQSPKRYGVRFMQHDASPMPVAGVDEGSPAFVAGLRAGDRIIQINGRPVEELSPADRADAFHSTPMELVALRGEERLVLTMRLE